MTHAEKEELIQIITRAVVAILEKNGTGCTGCSNAENCCSGRAESSTGQTSTSSDKHLITEEDILQFSRAGANQLHIRTHTILTPLAKDAARSKNIAIIRGDASRSTNRLDL